MSDKNNIAEKLKNNENVDKKEIINYAIGLQLKRIERQIDAENSSGAIYESVNDSLDRLIALLGKRN
ncbi:hypothetical protein MBBAR_1c02800 [Methanobrevibacter arboriphilus JCM 13429 = DSM 1125]|uniref:Uncharacterized protein n=1 Tax=Methanobrevibacter arboriphilus JCM 13429 = DSM 1125 TaxID=1300164 RepID=A0A1V6N580_METAZ|nr:hypothetical protein [Methanobrevibacter arboriphilus]OQD59870.1 hypothetical protein MBBAR_1c02800 [Methanobrevibacter arboriphilus JCM 13429 = DSM 1125]